MAMMYGCISIIQPGIGIVTSFYKVIVFQDSDYSHISSVKIEKTSRLPLKKAPTIGQVSICLEMCTCIPDL